MDTGPRHAHVVLYNWANKSDPQWNEKIIHDYDGIEGVIPVFWRQIQLFTSLERHTSLLTAVTVPRHDVLYNWANKSDPQWNVKITHDYGGIACVIPEFWRQIQLLTSQSVIPVFWRRLQFLSVNFHIIEQTNQTPNLKIIHDYGGIAGVKPVFWRQIRLLTSLERHTSLSTAVTVPRHEFSYNWANKSDPQGHGKTKI